MAQRTWRSFILTSHGSVSVSGPSVALPGDTFKSSREFAPQNFSLKQKKRAHTREERKRVREEEGGGEEIWEASKVIYTHGGSKMIMDNSKVWPREGIKIVHSRYFTAAARLAGGRELGNTLKSTQGEQCRLERERERRKETERGKDKRGEREKERGRQNSSLPEFNIVYVPEKTRCARERSIYPHMQL